MKVLVLGLVCIIWLQSSCSAPKWTGRKYGVFYVDDLDTPTDYDFSDLELVLKAMELKRYHCNTGHPQELMDPDYKSKPPSVFWAVMTAFRGLYVLWMFQFFCLWYMETAEPTDKDCSSATMDDSKNNGRDSGGSPADEDSHGAENLDMDYDVTVNDHSEDDGSDTGGSPAEEGYKEDDNLDTDRRATLEDDLNLSFVEEDSIEAPIVTVESALEEDVVRQVVQVMVDVVSAAQKLVEDVAIAVDMQVGDGFPQKKLPSVDPPIELFECPLTVTDNCVSDMVDAIKQVSCVDGIKRVPRCSSFSEGSSSEISMDTTERVLLMGRLERAFLMRSRPPDDIAVPGTSGALDGEPVPDGKKNNFNRRAKKTLDEINETWMQEKAPYLRQIPKVRFQQQVEVKTFLVNRPMDRYQNKPKTSEMTRIEPLKREGDFVEVGLLRTKKRSITHRLLRGAMKLAFRKG